MNYTINQQLARLETIKDALKNAINQANPSHLLTSNRFEDFAAHITDYLGPKTQPVTQYTVTFSINGGSGTAPSAQTVNAGSTITLPNYTGTKSGYTQVSGWATSNSATTANYAFGDQITVNSNMTLYAVFKAVPITQYTVTFNINGGSGTAPSAQTVNAGSSITLPTYTGTKTGYTQVSGWATSNSATTASYAAGASFTPSGNITLYAVFTINQYTVSWTNPSNGTITAKQGSTTINNGSSKVRYGATVTLTFTPQSGRTLQSISWNKGNLASLSTLTATPTTFTMPDNAVTGIAATVTLVPQATITVQSSDTTYGTVSGGGTFDIGSQITIKATVKTGGKFVSWNDGNTNTTRTITVSENITYTATFEEATSGVKAVCYEYACTEPNDETGNPCYSSIGDEFKLYSKETVLQWFNVDEMNLKANYDGWVEFGKLKTKTYVDSGEGVNAPNSFGMYWIAVPVDKKITSFINNSTSLPDDLINKFTENRVIDSGAIQLALFTNVTLSDNKKYNLYGINLKGGKTNDLLISFVNNQ